MKFQDKIISVKISSLIYSLFAFVLMGVVFYFVKNFEFKENKISSVQVISKTPEKLMSCLIYLKDKRDLKFDYSKGYKPQTINDSTIKFNISNQLALRNLRFYFKYPVDSLQINKILFEIDSSLINVDFLDFTKNGDMDIKNSFNSFNIFTNRDNCYLEYNHTLYYKSDKTFLLFAGFIIIILSIILLLRVEYFKSINSLLNITLADLSWLLFLLLMFIPRPINNIVLIGSVLLLIANYSWAKFSSNKLNLMLVGYFILLMLNDIFISKSGFHDFRATESNLSFLIIPIYLSCVRNYKLLISLGISAIFLGIGFLFTSIINVSIFHNSFYLSFSEFTKYLHPVHYSYLVSFSIFYIHFKLKLDNKMKFLIQIMLFTFLILSGSKLMLIISGLLYMLLIFNNKKALVVVAIGLMFLTIFSPIKERFKEICDFDAISIISENYINNPNDTRVNGLTLRLLLWQESTRSLDNINEILFGLGVDKGTNEILRENLVNRGLTNYLKYSTHNQFINTYMRAGLIGLIFLLSWLGYVYALAFKFKSKLLLITILLFTFAMFTESVLQWSLGITFFVTILLTLINSEISNEDRNSWN